MNFGRSLILAIFRAVCVTGLLWGALTLGRISLSVIWVVTGCYWLRMILRRFNFAWWPIVKPVWSLLFGIFCVVVLWPVGWLPGLLLALFFADAGGSALGLFDSEEEKELKAMLEQFNLPREKWFEEATDRILAKQARERGLG